MDRRLTMLLIIGGLVWSLLTFFFGMMVGSHGSQQKINQKLSNMGWMTLEKYRLEEMCKQRRHLASTRQPAVASSTPAPSSDWKQRKTQAAAWKKLALAKQVAPQALPRPVVRKAKPRKRKSLPPKKRKPRIRKVALAKKKPKVKKKTKKTGRFGFVSRRRARYTVLVRSRRSSLSLLRLRRMFIRKGYSPILQLRNLPRKGRRYILTAGRFRTRSQARKFQRVLRRRHGFRTRIIRMR